MKNLPHIDDKVNLTHLFDNRIGLVIISIGYDFKMVLYGTTFVYFNNKLLKIMIYPITPKSKKNPILFNMVFCYEKNVVPHKKLSG